MKVIHHLGNQAELMMISFSVGVLLILFTPIPASLLDVLLIINFSWALMMLLLTFYIDKPLSFSTFPSLLLISTLFRLSLNISATRLILSQAQAGHVIEAMGTYVIQGNYVMGLVVFLILIIVQYIVVTNGAQRVAEVAARFTLDSMPGKQMSIDADLNMGLISQEEAKHRREAIEKEANFYGAMDGASKFVKGDAVAGILIVLVDIIGGFAIGLAQKGMTWSESIHTYTLLTVGDGLVTQIPALIISTATGIIVTRAATDAQLGAEVSRQIAAHPKSLLMVSAGLLGLLCLRGMPSLPVLLILSLFVFTSVKVLRQKTQEEPDSNLGDTQKEEDTLYEQMRIHPIEIGFSPKLYTALKPQQADLIDKIQTLRKNIAMELGIVLPAVKFSQDKQLNSKHYQILIHGNPQGGGQLFPEHILAINTGGSKTELPGVKTRDPSYGLPAIWITTQHQIAAQAQNYTLVDVATVLMTHLNELIRSHIPDLLSRRDTEQLLNQDTFKSLSEELIPNGLNLTQIQKILQNLLAEQVSIRDLDTILSTLLEHSPNKDLAQLTEACRMSLADSICHRLAQPGKHLSVLTLAAPIEQQLVQSMSAQSLVMEPKITERFIKTLASQTEKMMQQSKRPILLCSARLRQPIRQITARIMPTLNVLSMNEIPINYQVESFGVIEC